MANLLKYLTDRKDGYQKMLWHMEEAPMSQLEQEASRLFRNPTKLNGWLEQYDIATLVLLKDHIESPYVELFYKFTSNYKSPQAIEELIIEAAAYDCPDIIHSFAYYMAEMKYPLNAKTIIECVIRNHSIDLHYLNSLFPESSQKALDICAEQKIHFMRFRDLLESGVHPKLKNIHYQDSWFEKEYQKYAS